MVQAKLLSSRAQRMFSEGVRKTSELTVALPEAVVRKLTAGVAVSVAAVHAYYRSHRALYGSTAYVRIAPAIRSQLLSARKNAVLTRWLAKVRVGEPKPNLD